VTDRLVSVGDDFALPGLVANKLANQVGDSTTTIGGAVASSVRANAAAPWRANIAYAAGQPVVNPSGDLVTAKATFTSGATYTAANWKLSSTYASATLPALLSGGRTWGFLGDSITHGSNAAAGRRYVDYIPWLVGTQSISPTTPNTALTGVTYSSEAGVPGERTDQMLARVDALIATGITGMTLLGGTNDASQGVSTATFMGNVTAIAAKCRNAGIPLVVGTVPPRGAAAATAIHTSIIGYNMALRQWAPKAGVYLAGVHGALVDVSSGAMLATYDSGDNTHPTTAGHRKIAEAFAAAIKRAILPQTMIVSAKSAVSLVSNPMFQTDSSGWYEQPGGTGTAPVYSLVADTTGRLPAGAQWYQMDFDGTASGGTRMLATQLAATGWAVGDNLLIAASVDLTDVSGYAAAANADPATAQFKLALYDQNGAALPNAQSGPPPLGTAPGEMAFVFQVPSGVTGLFLYVPVTLPTGAHLKFRISAVDIRNLTALGVTGY
jgi:lysophospholipase L1-like esterase